MEARYYEDYINNMKGQAALISVFFVMMIMLSAVFGVSSLAINEHSIANQNFTSSKSFYAAEAGIEDAVYRFKNSKNIPASFSTTLSGATAITTITVLNNIQTIASNGLSHDAVRSVSATLVESTDAAQFFYGVQVGDGGLTMDNNASVLGNIYSNGSVVGSPGVSITGDVTVAGGINDNPTNEWTTQDTNQVFATVSANRDIAQSFIAGASGSLNKISVYLAKIGNPGSNITLHITADNGNKPATASLTNGTIMPVSVGATPSWIDVSIGTTPTLSNGTKYWIVLDYGSNSSSNYWIWGKDSSDAYGNNTGKYANDWDSSNATWVSVGGDLAFRAWIGGVNNKIDSVTIGDANSGTGHANLFANTTIHDSSCPNSYCIIENPGRKEFPISDGVITDWKTDAAQGGTINGDYSIADNIVVGPKEITGDLLLTSNNKTLTVLGTIYVHGNIKIDNGSTIRCAVAYGTNSCVVVSDGWIDVKNNGIFSGSGQPSSYIMLLSTASCTGTSTSVPPCDDAPDYAAINLHNGAQGAIFYASRGMLVIYNGVDITEATAYKMHINQTASVTYKQGLASLNFSSGPSGGWSIASWQEIAP